MMLPREPRFRHGSTRWRNSISFVVPSSFWVDPEGRIERTYIGRLDRDRLLRDFQLLAKRR